MDINVKLAQKPCIQSLNNLNSLTPSEKEELRLFFYEKTGILPKASCSSCVEVWARLYRNTFNSLPKEVEKVNHKEKMVVEQPKDVEGTKVIIEEEKELPPKEEIKSIPKKPYKKKK